MIRDKCPACHKMIHTPTEGMYPMINMQTAPMIYDDGTTNFCRCKPASEHSPTPWMAEQVTFDTRDIRVRGAGYRLRDSKGCEVGAIMGAAEANRVVRAVNCHEELASALGDLCDTLRRLIDQGDHGTLPQVSGLIERADATLAKARGEA